MRAFYAQHANFRGLFHGRHSTCEPVIVSGPKSRSVRILAGFRVAVTAAEGIRRDMVAGGVEKTHAVAFFRRPVIAEDGFFQLGPQGGGETAFRETARLVFSCPQCLIKQKDLAVSVSAYYKRILRRLIQR